MKFYYLLAYIFTAYNSFCMMNFFDYFLDLKAHKYNFIIFFTNDSCKIEKHEFEQTIFFPKDKQSDLQKQSDLMVRFNNILNNLGSSSTIETVEGDTKKLFEQITDINDYEFDKKITINYKNGSKQTDIENSEQQITLDDNIESVCIKLNKKDPTKHKGDGSGSGIKGSGSGIKGSGSGIKGSGSESEKKCCC